MGKLFTTSTGDLKALGGEFVFDGPDNVTWCHRMSATLSSCLFPADPHPTYTSIVTKCKALTEYLSAGRTHAVTLQWPRLPPPQAFQSLPDRLCATLVPLMMITRLPH